MIDIIFWVFPIAAVILIVVTVILIHNVTVKRNTCNTCEGIVVGFHVNTAEVQLSANETRTVSPIISYQVNGVQYQFVGNFCTTSMKTGDKLTILYNRNRPEKAYIQKGVYLGPMITGCLGTVFFIFSVLYFCLKNTGMIN